MSCNQHTNGVIDVICISMFSSLSETHCWRKEGNVLFNDALNTFYLLLYVIGHMVKDHSVREETHCRHMGYSFRLTAKVILYAPSHRQDSTYHRLCYTSSGSLAGTRNSSVGPPHEGSLRWPIAPWANALTTELHLAPHIVDSTLGLIVWLNFIFSTVGKVLV